MADSSQSPATSLDLLGTPEDHNVLAQFGDGAGAAIGGRGSAPGVDEGEQLHRLREDAFDLTQEFVWAKDARVFKEVEEMVQLTFGGGVNRNKHRNQFVKSCFEMICSLAWQKYAAHEPRTDKVSLYKLLATAVEGVVLHYHLKAYARDRFFVHLPERNWPTDVLAKVEHEKAKTPKQDWLNQAAHAELRTRSVGEQRATLFGLEVYNTSISSYYAYISNFLLSHTGQNHPQLHHKPAERDLGGRRRTALWQHQERLLQGPPPAALALRLPQTRCSVDPQGQHAGGPSGAGAHDRPEDLRSGHCEKQEHRRRGEGVGRVLAPHLLAHVDHVGGAMR
jgi:hypothetical protein